jgi:exonuclease SbcC
MRPTRLELAGFGSWVDPTTIDFTGADVFALTGDTGAGKTSILDAISFALYGKAPRHGKKDVEPLINRSSNEARVRLDFLLDGEPLTVTRVLRRTANGGATTREARLEQLVTAPDGERDTQVIEHGAKDVTAAVERRIGLTWEHFTTAVILPQGRFQEFLLAPPGDRQDLLNELLRLGVFEQVKQRAGQRAKEHQASQEAMQAQLEGLRDASPDAVASAEARLAALVELVAERERVTAELDALRDDVQAARSDGARIEQQRAALDAVQPPAHLGDLAGALARATEERAAAASAVEQAEQVHARATAARAEQPETGMIRALLEAHEQLAERTRQLKPAEQAVTDAQQTAQAAAAALADGCTRLGEIHARLDDALRHDHAAAAAAGLAAGDPCPVCGRDLDEAPAMIADDVETARAALADQQQAIEALDQATRAAEEQRTRTEADLAGGRREHAALAQRIAARAAELAVEPEREAAAAALDRAKAADTAVADADTALGAARARHTQATAAADDAAEAIAGIEKQLRATLATLESLELEPPGDLPDGELAASWAGLADWARSRCRDLAEEGDKVDRRIQEITDRGTRLRDQFVDQAAGAEVAIDTGSRAFDEVTSAHARQQATLEQLRADVDTASRLRRQVRDHQNQQRLATLLAETLKANKLEKWLLGRVLRQLVGRASAVFHDLSGGDFSLRIEQGTTIEVVDHANADLARPVQSLSGGETFLASLAMALALADEVATLATDGAARLDALFIDEGFGTLDAETLDTVAAALQALGETGRMIGVVTHVRDLADQLPLRFEITRVGPASRVRRSDGREPA